MSQFESRSLVTAALVAAFIGVAPTAHAQRSGYRSYPTPTYNVPQRNYQVPTQFFQRAPVQQRTPSTVPQWPRYIAPAERFNEPNPNFRFNQVQPVPQRMPDHYF